MSSLLENISSDLMRAYAGLKSKKAPKKVLVYVESHDDQAFWRTILHEFENENLVFDIQLPSITTLAKNKGKALSRENDFLSLSTGTYLIICIDSDNDYLLQNKTAISEKINKSEYIFQTYSYSIENLRCFSESLHTLCVQSTKNDQKKIDIVLILKLYSVIVYKLFIWYMYFIYNNDYNTFTLTELTTLIKLLDNINIDDEGSSVLLTLKANVDSKIKNLETLFPNSIEHVNALADNLKTLGVTDENTYLFLQGHTIQDNVVLMLLKPLCNYLKKEKINEIKSKALHKNEMVSEINHYQNQYLPVELAVSLNTNFKSCFLYKKIEKDLQQYVSKLI
ncbi:DUF4435 domain-containing protein [Spirosoma litoris]